MSSATRVFQARKFFSGVSQLVLVGPVQRIRCGTPEPRDLLDRVALSLIVRRGVKKVAVVTHCFVPSSSTGLLSNGLAVISAQSPAAYICVFSTTVPLARRLFWASVDAYSVGVCCRGIAWFCVNGFEEKKEQARRGSSAAGWLHNRAGPVSSLFHCCGFLGYNCRKGALRGARSDPGDRNSVSRCVCVLSAITGGFESVQGRPSTSSENCGFYPTETAEGGSSRDFAFFTICSPASSASSVCIYPTAVYWKTRLLMT